MSVLGGDRFKKVTPVVSYGGGGYGVQNVLSNQGQEGTTSAGRYSAIQSHLQGGGSIEEYIGKIRERSASNRAARLERMKGWGKNKISLPERVGRLVKPVAQNAIAVPQGPAPDRSGQTIMDIAGASSDPDLGYSQYKMGEFTSAGQLYKAILAAGGDTSKMVRAYNSIGGQSTIKDWANRMPAASAIPQDIAQEWWEAATGQKLKGTPTTGAGEQWGVGP